MKPILIALALLALGAAGANAQSLTGERAIQYGEITVPAAQAQSPAGHDDIAFRPACDQLVPVLQATGTTAWTLQLPDGKTRILDEHPPALTTSEAHQALSASGLCKFGTAADGVIQAPIIYTHQLPEQAIADVAITPGQEQASGVVDETSTNWLLVLAGLGVLLGCGCGLVWLLTRQQSPVDSRLDAVLGRMPSLKQEGQADD